MDLSASALQSAPASEFDVIDGRSTDASNERGPSQVREERRFVLFLRANFPDSTDVFRLAGSKKVNVFCAVERRDNADQSRFVQVGVTEPIANSHEPKWTKPVEAISGESADDVLRFHLMNRVADGGPAETRRIGSADCTLQQLLLAERGRHELKLSNPAARSGTKLGSVFVYVEELTRDIGDFLTWQIVVSGFRAKKPYVVLSRAMSDGSMMPVYRSEVLRPTKATDFEFATAKIPLKFFCNGDRVRLLSLQLKEFSSKGKHTLSGDASFTLADLERDFLTGRKAPSPKAMMLRKKNACGTRVEVGRVAFKQCLVSSIYTLNDYVKKGVVVETVFAIDMSSTNGHPSDAHSYHYNNPNGQNEYVAAIREVGSVLAELDSTQVFPAWGFAAALPPHSRISHCFALSETSVCSEIDGVICAYRDRLNFVAPHQPCEYRGVLEKTISVIRKEIQRGSSLVYTVMALITDGDFSDFDTVSDIICDAASLPLTIIIVGIGHAEMPLLEKLGGEYGPLCNSCGIPASRDIVHFLPFHQHRGSPVQLKTNIVTAISRQALSFFRSCGLRPGDSESQWSQALSRLKADPIHGEPSYSSNLDANAFRNNFHHPSPEERPSGRVNSTLDSSQDLSQPLENVGRQGSLTSSGSLTNSSSRWPMYPSSTPVCPPPAITRHGSLGSSAGPDGVNLYGSLSRQSSALSRRTSYNQAPQLGAWTPAMPGTAIQPGVYASPPQQAPVGHAGGPAGHSGAVYSGPVMQPVSTSPSPEAVELPQTLPPPDMPPLVHQDSYGMPAPFPAHDVHPQHGYQPPPGVPAHHGYMATQPQQYPPQYHPPPSPGYAPGMQGQPAATPGYAAGVQGHAAGAAGYAAGMHGHPAAAGGYPAGMQPQAAGQYMAAAHQVNAPPGGYAYAQYGPPVGAQYATHAPHAPLTHSYGGHAEQPPPMGYPSRPGGYGGQHASYYGAPRSGDGELDRSGDATRGVDVRVVPPPGSDSSK